MESKNFLLKDNNEKVNGILKDSGGDTKQINI